MRQCLAAVLVLALPSAGFAADLDLASRVESVTVYPDAAVVTRAGRADLPAGVSTLVLRGLPASIDAASIRVEGQGSGAFSIGAVDVRLAPGEARPVVDAELEGRIDRLRDERDIVAARLVALEGKRGAIERYAQASPERLGQDGKPFEVGQWQTAWEAIGAGLAGVGEEIRLARARGRDLDGQIGALERARPTPARPGAPKRDVSIALEAASALQGEIRVTYRVAGASWTPLYDARLDTGAPDRKPSLDLVRRAQIVQRTGEEWRDVDLSVSTTRVTRGAAAPDLPPVQVSFYEPPTVYRPAAAPSSAAAPRRARAPGQEAGAPEPVVPADPALQQTATLEAGAFQATFRVPGRVSVPLDGATKTVVLGERRVEPALAVTAAPELDETAYLRASFTQEDEAPLLPGEAALHRDGVLVGRSRLKLAATGDLVELGFGADDRVKVSRVPLRRRENEPGWIGQTKSDLREFKTVVRNGHARPVRITITDRLPFSENTAITVEQLRETTPPTEKQPGDRRGVVAWTYDYAAGEQREMRLAYRLRWPAEREVVFEAKPVGAGAAPRS